MYKRIGQLVSLSVALKVGMILGMLCSCRPVPSVDPAKLERAVKSMEKAAAATSEAIDAARDAAVIPEEPEVEAVPSP